MTADGLSERGAGAGASGPTIEIVVPVHNEALVAEASIRALAAYVEARFPFPTLITVADSASTDRTWEAASRVAAEVPGVRAVHLDQRGRGRALRSVWSASEAEVVACIDVDLSTDLDAILPLVAPLVSGQGDIAIASRGTRAVRGASGGVLSRSSHLLVRATTGRRFTDVQCGFKAARSEVVRRLLPLVEDDDWFFDTELLVLAERRGLRIRSAPVDRVDAPEPSRGILAASLADLKGLWRDSRGALRRRAPGAASPPGHYGDEITARFVTIGGISAAVYVVLLLILQPQAGTLGANAIALTLCAVGNAAAHRGLVSTLAPFPTVDGTWLQRLGAGRPAEAESSVAAETARATETTGAETTGAQTAMTAETGAAAAEARAAETATTAATGAAAAEAGTAAAEARAAEAALAGRHLRRWAALRRGEACQVGRPAVIAWAATLALSTLALLAAAAVSRSMVVAVVAVLGVSAVIGAARLVTLRAVMYQHHLDTVDTPEAPRGEEPAPPGPLGTPESAPPESASPMHPQPTGLPTWRSR